MLFTCFFVLHNVILLLLVLHDALPLLLILLHNTLLLLVDHGLPLLLQGVLQVGALLEVLQAALQDALEGLCFLHLDLALLVLHPGLGKDGLVRGYL